MSSANVLDRVRAISTLLQDEHPSMATIASKDTPTAAPTPVDNEIKGRLALVTGASGG